MKKIENTSGIPDDDFMREGLVDRLKQYLAAEPGAWHVRYNLGVALMQSGEVDEALTEFRQVMAESPKHMESMVNVAAIHLGKGEPEEALKVLTNALKVWDIPLVRANLGVAYLQMDRLDEAAEQLKTALNSAPNMPDALTNLSTIFLRQDNPDKAAEAAREALKFNENFAMAHNNLAVVLSERGEKDQARFHALRARELGYALHPDLAGRLDLPSE
ncbi:MAG: tetratricopeptide repeat protein [Desulfarculaceae bacterium]|nr:tetratricopeptide repeat protein [Desulfarculaceae bacterium]MCF8073541.1 tetratricopeptide repeat protein [Desulfarculaceae bacterium]MCF8103063.1 tetratricopeptide repeat protein [Desulfarculaceae bacterium]MCF8115743.1 tetratricopeptide repeat protein [Desulfarculaceae bacterium]